MDRRDFLKSGVAAAGYMTLASCAEAGKDKNQQEHGEMTYRSDASGEDQVSILGYGCMRWPEKKNEDGSKAPDQEMVNQLVDHALANGINYFDTAPVYHSGQSENATGIALARHNRSDYYIATKLSNFDPRTHSREKSMEMYENSFEYLQTDYIDYYLLHSLGGDIEGFNNRYIKNGMLDFLVQEREEGRIRHLGFSFHGDAKSFDYYLNLHHKYHWDFVQIQMNYLDWDYATQNNPRNCNGRYLYGELEKMGIPAVIMEPLLGGRLARVPEAIADRLQEREPSQSVASWAFRFCGSFPGVMSVLSGMTYMEHLEDNLATYSPLKPLSEEDFQFLDSTAKLMMEYPTIPCNDCKYCIPCPYAIDIPGLLQHYNKCVNEGSIAADRMDPNYRKARRKFLTSLDKTIPQLRQADKCIGCKQCVPKCPQSIDIPKELRRLDRYVEKLKRDEL